jgi:hypothetical protein
MPASPPPASGMTGMFHMRQRAYWPGLGRNWARHPAPRGVWARAALRGFWAGLLTVF